MEKTEKPVNEKLDRKIQWIVFIVIFSAMPYLLRVLFFLIWHKEVPDFYVGELDIYAYSIALIIALFIELKNLKKLPYDLSSNVCHGIIMMYMVCIIACVGISLDVEHEITKLNQYYCDLLQENNSTKKILDEIQSMKDTESAMYILSIVLATITTYGSYKTLFHPSND